MTHSRLCRASVYANRKVDELMAANTPLLDTIQCPADLRCLEIQQLDQVAAELRSETISAVAVTGGHLGAGLGVVELTVALHYAVSYTHLRAHETDSYLVCRLLLEKKKNNSCKIIT